MPTTRVLVTLEGYSVEGGFDGPYQPATCYTPTIALRRHTGPGEGVGLWRDYERVLEHVSSLGVDGVRLALEWARLEPRDGVLDETAVTRYREVLDYAATHAGVVAVSLVERTWPSWLGLEAWLLPWVVDKTLRHARRVVELFGDQFSDLVLFSDVEALVGPGYLEGSAPPWRRGAREDAQSVRDQLARVAALALEDEVVGPRLVNPRTVALDGSVRELERVLAETPASTPVHVRSLVRGVGPTAAPAGLLSRHGGDWVVSGDPELLRVLARGSLA